jgi:cyanophycinase
MDVVGHNVVRFELPAYEEDSALALVKDAQMAFKQPAFPLPESDAARLLPHCFAEGDVLNFACAAKSTSYPQFDGSLFLIGGRADDTFYELLKLAPKNPKVVVVGRASGRVGADEELAEEFFKAGVKLDDITIVVPKDYQAKDTRFRHSYEVPEDADVVYFGGGAQDKLRREFDNHQLDQVRKLLKKGALIGGNSAGTAVMSEEMINGGDEHKIEQSHGFGLTPWAILDTHVGQRHREARDVKALYEIGDGKRPVIGLDEDTRVRFYWKDGKLLGEIGGKGLAKVFQTPEMPPLIVNRSIMSKLLTDGVQREAVVWELKDGDVFEVQLPAADAVKPAVEVPLVKPA